MKTFTLTLVTISVFFLAIFQAINTYANNKTEYHFQEGFFLEPGDDIVPPGWTSHRTYPTFRYNNGKYTEPDQEGFRDRSIRFLDGGSWLATPPIDGAGVLAFFVNVAEGDEGDGSEKLVVSKHINETDSIFLAEYDAEVLEEETWVEFEIEINDPSESIIIKFTRSMESWYSNDIYVDDVSLTVYEPTSVTESEVNDFVLYPNPAIDILNLIFPDDQLRSVSIIDVSGRTIWSGKVEGENAQIDISGLIQGFYMIRVKDNNHSYTNGFIKKMF